MKKHSLLFVLVLPLAFLLSACNHVEPETGKVLFVFDLSNSASKWKEAQVNSANNWIQNHTDSFWEVSYASLDAYAGSENCVTSSQTIDEGDANNPDTAAIARRDATNRLISELGEWLKCETDGDQINGSDINLLSFEGQQNVVIFTDGLLHSEDKNGLNLSRGVTGDFDSLKTELDEYLNTIGADLSGTSVEVYGLGYRADLSSVELANLQNAWEYLLNQAGASNVTIQGDLL